MLKQESERSKLTHRFITAPVVTAPVIGFGVDMTSCRYECPLAFFWFGMRKQFTTTVMFTKITRSHTLLVAQY